METKTDEDFTKQYSNKCDSASENTLIKPEHKIKIEINQVFESVTVPNFKEQIEEPINLISNYHIPLEPLEPLDEPIDLTSNRSSKNLGENIKMQHFYRSYGNYNNNSQRKNRRAQPENENYYVTPYIDIQPYFPTGPPKEASPRDEEVIKAAKTLFSKRTRTLYHWLYPDTPKQHIKIAVANSWDSLSLNEKDFYISQVLGRCSFSQNNLMINPQLGGFRELPYSGRFTTVTHPEFASQNFSELQNAISSIAQSGTASNKNSIELNMSVAPELYEIPDLKGKRKRSKSYGGRKRNEEEGANQVNTANEFQDDPELKRELEQFALNMSWSSIS